MQLLLEAETWQILTVLGLGAGILVALRRLVVDRRPWGARLLAGLRRLEIALLCLLLGLMIVCSALQIVLRNATGSGLLWIDPFLRYLTLWIGFLGAAFATAAGRHIQIDIAARLSPPRLRRLAARIVSAVAAGVTLVLAETAYRHVVAEAGYGAVGVLGLPSWSLLVVMPAGFALMSYRFLYRVAAPAAVLARGDRETYEPGGTGDGPVPPAPAAGGEATPADPLPGDAAPGEATP
ncbi:MAG: TRAP transporter small permease [Candidatus Eiseniibacteriota bacterium]